MSYIYPAYKEIIRGLELHSFFTYENEIQEEKRLFKQDLVGAYFNNWIAEFREGENPIREWATLFWHQHLPCTGRGQNNVFNLEQNYLTWEMYRRNALGNYKQLLIDFYQNPSSMYFLDIHRSYKENPNQNFARELLELYTLGPGNYTEKDVREIARCFTGLHFEKKDAYFQKAYRVESQFDSGVKEILGKRGNFYPEDVIDIILEKPECASFIAQKAVYFFLGGGTSVGFQKKCGKVYYESNYDFNALLTFMYDHSESNNNKLRRVKSPIEHLVFFQRDLEIKTMGQKTNSWLLRKWGQYPLSPWTVKGWPMRENWLVGEYLLHRTFLPPVLLEIANRKNSKNSMTYKVQSRLYHSNFREIRYLLDAEWNEDKFNEKLSDLDKSLNQYLLGSSKADDRNLVECLTSPDYQYFNPVEKKRLFKN